MNHHPYASQYAPPGPQYRQNFFVPPGARSGPVPSPTLRKVEFVAAIVALISMTVGLVVFVVGIVTETQAAMIGGAGFFGLWEISLIAYSICNLVWIYQFWSWIPPEQRHTKLWKKYISPGVAVGFMFIPYFNVFWMFVIWLGLCDIFDRLRVAYPTSEEPPRGLVIGTMVCAFVFFPAAPFLHAMLAKRFEALALETQMRMLEAPQPPAPPPPYAPGYGAGPYAQGGYPY